VAIAAANDLFLERDYVTTTMGGVAERAGVSEQSLYYLFGTKCELLAAVLAATVRGDGEPVPVVDQPWVDGLADAPDAATAIEEMIKSSIGIVARTAAIYGVIQRGSADPDVRELLEVTRRRRRSDQRRLIGVLADAGHLRPGADLAAAADVFYGLVNEEVYLLLTVDCGWSRERFRTWVTITMEHELLRC
jgi:AcrR family transcriptional regulator